MSAVINPRKLLARMDVHGSSPMFHCGKRSELVGTAPDAAFHAPPDPHAVVDVDELKFEATWRRVERAIALLRESSWGSASQIHVRSSRYASPQREQADCDIAASLAFAGGSGVGQRVAQFVYLFRSWDMFADRNLEAMLSICRTMFLGFINSDAGHAWKKREVVVHRCQDICESAIDEFRHPERCIECDGYGEETTGVRAGMRCPHCGGRGLVEWSANRRARTLRVRRQDWQPIWSRPYLSLFDKLNELERAGAYRHAQALGT